MIIPTKPGAVLAQITGPVIETECLILRPWRAADIAPNTAMLSDPPTARYITADNKPVTSELVGWRNAAVMAGHWALHGWGMFVVEEKSSRQYVGRVGPWFPPVGRVSKSVGALQEFRGEGYALETGAGRRSTGPLPASRLTASFIASMSRARRRNPWHCGSGREKVGNSI